MTIHNFCDMLSSSTRVYIYIQTSLLSNRLKMQSISTVLSEVSATAWNCTILSEWRTSFKEKWWIGHRAWRNVQVFFYRRVSSILAWRRFAKTNAKDVGKQRIFATLTRMSETRRTLLKWGGDAKRRNSCWNWGRCLVGVWFVEELP